MDFQVGDKVVHWAYGPGEVIQLDHKMIAGSPTDCYVVRVGEMTIWVPKNLDGSSSLRLPTPANEFDDLFQILKSPGEPLSGDRFERKTQLLEKMKDGTLSAICKVVRDLTLLKKTRKMNDHDTSTLERALKFLTLEWQVSLDTPGKDVEQALKQLLGEAELNH